MNKSEKVLPEDSYRDLLILEELSGDKKVTQRDLSHKLGIALGLVNSYIKNLAAKGYITVSTIPKKQYKYYLTPKGFLEKSRLAYQHLYNFTNLYNIARNDFRGLFQKIQDDGAKKIVFCGVDEVTEIAYLTIQEFDLELVAVIGDNESQKEFFGLSVGLPEDLKDTDYDRILLTCQLRSIKLYTMLLDSGIPSELVVVPDGYL